MGRVVRADALNFPLVLGGGEAERVACSLGWCWGQSEMWRGPIKEEE